jgi:hypothetical protein
MRKFVTYLKNLHILHSWSQWEQVEDYNARSDGKIIGKLIVYKRSCDVCKKPQLDQKSIAF